MAAVIPGPGMIALVARSANSGALTGFSMLLGLILGDLTYLSFAVFGLAVLAKTFNTIFFLVKWGAIAYLCYLAWQFWHAGHQSFKPDTAPTGSDFISAGISGYSVTLSNPKTIAFYLALVPTVINVEKVTLESWGFVLVPMTTVILLCVGALFILAAISVRSVLSGRKTQKLLHRGAAGAMLGAASTMAAKEM